MKLQYFIIEVSLKYAELIGGNGRDIIRKEEHFEERISDTSRFRRTV